MQNSVVTYFNPRNIDHIAAYDYLCRNGYWPDDFWKEIRDLEFNPTWHMLLMSKIADAWRDAVQKDEVFGMPPYKENRYNM